MDYFEKLNELIKEIENNLTEEIDYKKLAKIIGTSSYTMQRIFVFLTGITLTEYIRKRRLSKAAEELISSNSKIIDIALKYQYDSPVSFSNSFKKMHGVSPQNFRKNNLLVKNFPIIEFKPIIDIIEELEYRIVELDSQTLYGVTTGIIEMSNSKKIANLFKQAKDENILDFIINNSNGKELYYGASQIIYNNDITKKMKYYILGTKGRKDFIELNIPKATWACFKLNNKDQDYILKLYNTIYTKFLPNSNFSEILNYPELEIYYKDDCEICIPIR